jgi:hypothetical protein
MKKVIILISLCVLSIIVFSQPIVQRAGNSTTVQDANLFTQNSFRLPVFADTTAATISLDSCGKACYIRNNGLWYRECSPKRWIQLSSTSGATYTAGYGLTLAANVFKADTTKLVYKDTGVLQTGGFNINGGIKADSFKVPSNQGVDWVISNPDVSGGDRLAFIQHNTRFVGQPDNPVREVTAWIGSGGIVFSIGHELSGDSHSAGFMFGDRHTTWVHNYQFYSDSLIGHCDFTNGSNYAPNHFNTTIFTFDSTKKVTFSGLTNVSYYEGFSNGQVTDSTLTTKRFNDSVYVPMSRTLTAGFGVNTIGNLSANRTISIDTTSGGASSWKLPYRLRDSMIAVNNARYAALTGPQTIAGATTFTSLITTPYVVETGTGVPTITINANAGTGATATLAANSDDVTGTINFTAGTGFVATGQNLILTFTFSTTYTKPRFILLFRQGDSSPTNINTVAFYPDTNSATSTSFPIKNFISSLSNGQTYPIGYHVFF